MKFAWGMLSLLLVLGWPAAVPGADLRITAVKPGALVSVDRLIGDDKALLSVADAGGTPLTGLGIPDFAVSRGEVPATVTAVQPIAESLEVPRHIVMVLDNSDSMRQRNAVDPLQSGVDELLKIVRPIDQVHVVVFDSRQTVQMGGRDLRVRTFASNRPSVLRNFVAGVYRDSMTASTVLYEAMLAGLEIIRGLPAEEPKFLVVFSDGEDLNSAYGRDEVTRASQGLARFDAYAIDYLPGMAINPFLAAFASQNNGQIWKAASEANLVPIFQSVASKMQYYYVVSYLFPPRGALQIAPTSLTIDEVLAGSELSGRIDAAVLKLSPALETPYEIEGWRLVVANAGGVLFERSETGAPAGDLMVPLPIYNLGALAAGGALTVTLDIKDRKGQALTLAAPPVQVNVVRTVASLAVSPDSVTVEEIRTIDASPMLGHIYFAKESGELPERYVRLAGPETAAAFNEQAFRDTLEKYYQVLNIIGKRLADHPEATVTLVGCNAHVGKEKKNGRLSTRRAQAVRDYLQSVWGIAPERMVIETRNLPEKPSTSRYEEGQMENRRVEIRSTHPAILDLVRSTYFTTRIDTHALAVKPAAVMPHGGARWKVTVANAGGSLGELAGEGVPAAQLTLPLPTAGLDALATGGDLAVALTLHDQKGRELAVAPVPVKVNFIRTSQRQAEQQGLRVQEKYALILFDFDKDTIDGRNRAIVDAIVARIRELPEATVEIVGHTDNIGKEDYNLRLSERRALAVYKLLADAYGEVPGERIRYLGVGSADPLYDNLSPETRSLNRTVTITLDYLAAE